MGKSSSQRAAKTTSRQVTKVKSTEKSEATLVSLTVADYARSVIHEQYRRIIKQERQVLADKDPEHLHQMRVGTRRLRTALQVFECAVNLPKAVSLKRVGAIAKVLGRLRDLDVQIAVLKNDYYPQLSDAEQKKLDSVLALLEKRRGKAFAGVEYTLNHTKYRDFKAAYEIWLSHPEYKLLAQSRLQPLLPALLNPLLSSLLLHSGWLVSTHDLSAANSLILHDLRKVCKHVRYQAEFFAQFYDEAFTNWLQEIKTLQENLGLVQDGQILLSSLAAELPSTTRLPELEKIIREEQNKALSTWETTRQKYLDPAFQHQLYQMLLSIFHEENLVVVLK
jgi:CHAD domain-containing protein